MQRTYSSQNNFVKDKNKLDFKACSKMTLLKAICGVGIGTNI